MNPEQKNEPNKKPEEKDLKESELEQVTGGAPALGAGAQSLPGGTAQALSGATAQALPGSRTA
jgi:hypothetical protein